MPETSSKARMMAIAKPIKRLKPERATGNTDEPIPILRLPTPDFWHRRGAFALPTPLASLAVPIRVAVRSCPGSRLRHSAFPLSPSVIERWKITGRANVLSIDFGSVRLLLCKFAPFWTENPHSAASLCAAQKFLDIFLCAAYISANRLKRGHLRERRHCHVQVD